MISTGASLPVTCSSLYCVSARNLGEAVRITHPTRQHFGAIIRHMANNMTASIPQSNIESYRATMRGEVLEPSNPSYDESRVVWNGMIDRRPALIARCRNAADVAASVNFARDHGLPIAIRSGGHNVAGYAVCNDGLMIDMSLMNAA